MSRLFATTTMGPMTAVINPLAPAAAPTAPDPRRWLILGVLGLAQMMVVLDGTIVNIALPTAQVALGFSNNDRQWVVTGYALAFGSLLLLGGRLSDLFGRKRMFLVGLVGFACGSALGGASTTFGMLVTARAVQGASGALLAPAAWPTFPWSLPSASPRWSPTPSCCREPDRDPSCPQGSSSPPLA